MKYRIELVLVYMFMAIFVAPVLARVFPWIVGTYHKILEVIHIDVNAELFMRDASFIIFVSVFLALIVQGSIHRNPFAIFRIEAVRRNLIFASLYNALVYPFVKGYFYTNNRYLNIIDSADRYMLGVPGYLQDNFYLEVGLIVAITMFITFLLISFFDKAQHDDHEERRRQAEKAMAPPKPRRNIFGKVRSDPDMG